MCGPLRTSSLRDRIKYSHGGKKQLVKLNSISRTAQVLKFRVLVLHTRCFSVSLGNLSVHWFEFNNHWINCIILSKGMPSWWGLPASGIKKLRAVWRFYLQTLNTYIHIDTHTQINKNNYRQCYWPEPENREI